MGRTGAIGQVTDDMLKRFLINKGIDASQVNQIISGTSTVGASASIPANIDIPAIQRQGRTLSSPVQPAPAPQATTANLAPLSAQTTAARQAAQQQAVDQMKATAQANQTASAQRNAAEQAYKIAIAKQPFQQTSADKAAIRTAKSMGIAESVNIQESQVLTTQQINAALIKAAQILATSGVRAPASGSGTGTALGNLAKGIISAPFQAAGAAAGGAVRGYTAARNNAGFGGFGMSGGSAVIPKPSANSMSNIQIRQAITDLYAELSRRKGQT